MHFMTVRDLRNKAAQVWRLLPDEKEIVLTLNGNPIAILSAVSGDTLEESLAMIRRARAMAAVNRLQTRSARSGSGRLGSTEIEREIATARRQRRS